MTAVEDYLQRRGEYRRAILLSGQPGRVDAELEDNVHHFTAKLWHDGSKVLRVEGGSIRTPYTTCNAGAEQMGALAGSPVAADARASYAFTDVRFQCTHAFQLAVHAIAHVARGTAVWLYEVAIHDEGGDRRVAQMRLNGEVVLEWRLHDDKIEAPADLAGLRSSEAIKRVFRSDPQLAEAAVILHRALRQALSQRTVTHLANPIASALSARGNCFTFQPERAGTARSLDMTRNFEGEGVWPLRDKALELRAAANV